MTLPTITLGLAAGVALLGVILWRRAPGPRWVFVFAFAVILGALRYNSVQPHFNHTTLATHNDQPQSVIVAGRVLNHVAPARKRAGARSRHCAAGVAVCVQGARAKNVIAQILPEPQASLLTGILLGDDSGIPKSVQEAFRTTGTSHIIAISG